MERPEVVVGAHLPWVISQGYFFMQQGWCIQIRRAYHPAGSRQESGAHDTVAVKGPRAAGPRIRHESEIPDSLAIELYKMAPWKLVKERFSIVFEGRAWEIDVFHHENEGLALAECTDGWDGGTPPDWCTSEVTEDHRYDNEELARRPIVTW